MDVFVGLVIAGGLGYWTYRDARTLDERGIRVLNWSPKAWGWLVFLVALVFGILYLICRSRAVATGAGPRPAPERDPVPDAAPRRFCPKCGTEIVPYAAYCHGCGRELERIAP